MNHSTASAQDNIPQSTTNNFTSLSTKLLSRKISIPSERKNTKHAYNSALNNSNRKNYPYVKLNSELPTLSEFDTARPGSSVHKINKNEVLLHQGDEALYFYQIIFGHLKTYTLLNDGRCQIINFLRKGDFIGIPYEKNYSISAQALTRANVRCYSYSQMKSLMETSPIFTRKILEITQKELSQATNQMVLLGRKNPEEKVASFLLSCERSLTEKQDHQMMLYLPMSLNDIADHLGLAQETVCRILGKYKRSGLVEFKTPRQQSELYVRDMQSLYEIAELEA